MKSFVRFFLIEGLFCGTIASNEKIRRKVEGESDADTSCGFFEILQSKYARRLSARHCRIIKKVPRRAHHAF